MKNTPWDACPRGIKLEINKNSDRIVDLIGLFCYPVLCLSERFIEWYGRNFMIESIKDWAVSFRKNFIGNTIFFIFIVSYIMIFQAMFGAENSITGVCMTLIMTSSMSKDMTGALLKNLLMQAAVLVFMSVSACLTVTLNPFMAAVVNFAAVFILSILFMSETSASQYFIYLLSYSFLVFISPITFEGLPKRIIAVLFGALCVMAYQFILGRKRINKISTGALKALIHYITDENPIGSTELTELRKYICSVSKAVFDRKKAYFGISSAGIGLIDAARGLENIAVKADEISAKDSLDYERFLNWLNKKLYEFEEYIDGHNAKLEQISYDGALDDKTKDCYNSVIFVQEALKKMSAPENKKSVVHTDISFSERVKKAIDISPVKLNSSLRLAIIISLGTLAVQLLNLQYGKWLIFTFISLTMPYSEDVKPKAAKRMAATLIGCAAAVAAFTLIPSSGGRVAVTMIAGYLSSFFVGYTGNYACATIGALSGAVGGVIGFVPIATRCLIRLLYIGLGCAIVCLITNKLNNCHKTDTIAYLTDKYKTTALKISAMFSKGKMDIQEYYHYIIELNIIENRLHQEKNGEIESYIEKCRRIVADAHVGNVKAYTAAN